jgi:hypothetical protein
LDAVSYIPVLRTHKVMGSTSHGCIFPQGGKRLQMDVKTVSFAEDIKKNSALI